MKKIEINRNYHLCNEVQIRYYRILKMAYNYVSPGEGGGGVPGGWSRWPGGWPVGGWSRWPGGVPGGVPGGHLSFPFFFGGTAKPNLTNPDFVVAFSSGGGCVCIAFVDRDYQYGGTGGPDQFKQIFPVMGANVTVGNPYNRNYSAGLAVLNYEDKTIGIVKNEDVGAYGADGIRIVVYDQSSGQYRETLAVCDNISYVFPQAVNISPDGLELWFSYTGGFDGDCWMKCTRASTEEAFGQPVKQFEMPAAWKVLWHYSGKIWEIWFAGKDSDAWNDPACIYRGMDLTKKVSIKGFSTGFAFDDFGNLWVGTYTDSGLATRQYLLVFSVDKVNDSGVLGIEDADVKYKMPHLEIEGVSCLTGVSDIAYTEGYMYISANGYSAWDPSHDIGCILRIPTHAGTDQDPFAVQGDLEIRYKVTPTIDWDWLKAIGVSLI